MIELDVINQELLDVLQVEGRLSYRDLGERIGLSPPAIAERIRKLEDAGVITGYRATVDYERIGFPILCIIRLDTTRFDQAIDDMMAAAPEIVEAHRVTGSESHVIQARVRSTAHLEDLLERLWTHGSSVTNIVTSSPVARRPMSVRAVMAHREP